MARVRLLNPAFFTNELLLELPATARLLFQGLWCYADREGRLEDRPGRLKIQILPADDVNVDAMLAQLQDRGFIVRYAVDGLRCIQVVNFHKHQHPHPREAPSILPPAEAVPEQHLINEGPDLDTAEATPRRVQGNALVLPSRAGSSVNGLSDSRTLGLADAADRDLVPEEDHEPSSTQGATAPARTRPARAPRRAAPVISADWQALVVEFAGKLPGVLLLRRLERLESGPSPPSAADLRWALDKAVARTGGNPLPYALGALESGGRYGDAGRGNGTDHQAARSQVRAEGVLESWRRVGGAAVLDVPDVPG